MYFLFYLLYLIQIIFVIIISNIFFNVDNILQNIIILIVSWYIIISATIINYIYIIIKINENKFEDNYEISKLDYDYINRTEISIIPKYLVIGQTCVYTFLTVITIVAIYIQYNYITLIYLIASFILTVFNISIQLVLYKTPNNYELI